MQKREIVYDALLKYQVDFSMKQEISLLHKSDWDKYNKVLDYGCGNGYYLSKLKDVYPHKEYWACDRDESLLKISRSYIDAKTVCGEYPSVDLPSDFDLVITRYLTSYISDRKDFFSWIKAHSKNNASLLLVDAYDQELIVEPYLPLFMQGQTKFMESVKDNGGNRDIRDLCTAELSELGYKLVRTKTFDVNSSSPFVKEKLFAYMCLIASMDNNYTMTSELFDELTEWLVDPNSFVQYGTFVSLYQLQGG